MFGFNKKDKDVDKSITIPAPPQLIGTELFYPLSENKAKGYALLKMYKELPELQIPLNYIVDNIAGIPTQHIKILSNGTELPIRNSPVENVLRRPNQWDKTYTQFTRAYILNRMLFGAGFINRIETEFGITQLYVLPSNTTKAFMSGDKTDLRLANISKYVTDFGGGRMELKAEEVVSSYNTILDRQLLDGAVNPFSRVESMVLASRSLKAIYEAKIKMYEDRGALGIITPKEDGTILDKPASDRIKEDYYRRNGITGSKAPFMIGSIPLDYTPVTFNAKDLMLNENRLQDFNMMCAMLGIDPVVFGLAPATYANKEWSSVNMWNDTIKPTIKEYHETLQEVFRLPVGEGFKADYSDIAVLQVANLKAVSAYTTMLDKGAITIEQYKRLLNVV